MYVFIIIIVMQLLCIQIKFNTASIQKLEKNQKLAQLKLAVCCVKN